MRILKSVKNKIIVVLVIILLVNFVLMQPVSAKSWLASAGGKLLEPICEFLVFCGDSVLNALQNTLMIEQDVIIQANSTEEAGINWGNVGWTALAIVGTIGAIAIAATGVGALLEAVGAASIARSRSYYFSCCTEELQRLRLGSGLSAVGVYLVTNRASAVIAGLEGEFDLPMIAYTPYAIFSGSIPIFDINFFSEETTDIGSTEIGTEEAEIIGTSSASILRPVVSSWYVTLRTIAIVGMLSILLYIGIRIIIGSTSDKAKYKELLKDWIVAFFLLLIMHYIMVFTVTMTEKVSGIFAGSNNETILQPLHPDTTINGETLEADDDGNVYWACTFTGWCRLIAGGYDDTPNWTSISFTIIYLVLVIYTIIFTFKYLKRVLYMAFLTMIAPLVAMTYPLDKIHDGQAQGFNAWFKEYVFNALLQPFHMVLYALIISSVMGLAVDYPVYALVGIGFLFPAEKLLRSFFGFDKAGTLSAAGSFAAGTVFSALLNKVNRPKGSKGGGSGNQEEAKQKQGRKPDTKLNPEKELFGTSSNNRREAEATENEREENTREESAREINTNSKPQVEDNEMEDTPRTEAARIIFKQDSKANGSINNRDLPEWMQASRTPKRSGRIRNALTQMNRENVARIKGAVTLKNAGRLVRKGIVGGAGGATLGMAGLATGIAMGDPTKALGLTTAGAAAGYYGANYYGDKVAKEVGRQAKALRTGYWGTDLGRREREVFDKKFKSDPRNINELTKYVDPKTAKEAMNNGTVQAFLKAGVSDINLIGKSLLLQQKFMAGEDGYRHDGLVGNERESLARAVSLAKMYQGTDKAVFNINSAERKAHKEQLLQTMAEKYGISGREASRRVEEILNEEDFYNL